MEGSASPPHRCHTQMGAKKIKTKKKKKKKTKKEANPTAERSPAAEHPKLPVRGDGGSTATTRCDMAKVQKWGVRGAAVPTGCPYLSGPQRPAPLRNWATE